MTLLETKCGPPLTQKGELFSYNKNLMFTLNELLINILIINVIHKLTKSISS